jgi:hypothetical protein
MSARESELSLTLSKREDELYALKQRYADVLAMLVRVEGIARDELAMGPVLLADIRAVIAATAPRCA